MIKGRRRPEVTQKLRLVGDADTRPPDEDIARDEAADWVERSLALSRLATEGRMDLEEIPAAWLESPDARLRAEGVARLLTHWIASPNLEDHLAAALRQIAQDLDPVVRASAAGALAGYLMLLGAREARIMRALVSALERDDDWVVQRRCWEELLALVAPARLVDVPRHSFDREHDVDWSVLARWRDG